MAQDIGAKFRALHVPGHPFILANAWDIGSAKMLAALGAEAIATSSRAHAFTLGRVDGGNVTRDESMRYAQDLVLATPLPVSGDFENGYGDAPAICAETVHMSAAIGLAGISIEDENFAANDAYDFDFAVERIQAAVTAARGLPGDFVLVARADGLMNRRYDLDDAIRRIKAFDAAGADCVYVPFLPDVDALKRVVAATDLPVNALAVGPLDLVSRAEFANLGVARISLGSALASVTYRAIHDTAEAMFTKGDFTGLRNILSGSKLDDMMR